MRSRIDAAAIDADDVRPPVQAGLQRGLRKAVAKDRAGGQQADFLAHAALPV